MKKALFIILLLIILATGAVVYIRWDAGNAAPSRNSAPEAAESGAQPESSSQPAPPPDPATPDGAVEKLFQGVTQWDVSTMETYLPDGMTIAQYVPPAFEDSLMEVLGRMTYTVGETTVTGNTATVEMIITSADMNSAASGAIAATVAYVAKQKITGQPVGGYADIAKVAAESIDIGSLPTKEFPATAHMVMGGDGEWKLDLSDGANLPLLNALSGGSIDLAKQLKNTAESYGIDVSGM